MVDCTDQDILVALYNATGGPKWPNNTNWLTDAPLNDWYGVGADATGRIVRLQLTRNNLSGSIPRELGSLASLKYLYLYSNQLSGSIPRELGSLASLEELSLSSNQLSGPIPRELGSLASLRRLYLSSNQLSGSIPRELGSLASLEELSLSSNQLSGSIPRELGSLASLEELSLSSNQLSGPIPRELGSLASLRRLYLSSNQLSGSIPRELGSLASLEELYLRSNQLSGPIPRELGSLASLRRLYLSSNQLSGSIPRELGSLASLEELSLSFNQLSGSIPRELGSLASLEELYLRSNQLSGSIPRELGSLASLRRLYLYGNQLSGSIPRELGSLASLEYLYLYSNQLSGLIPWELGNLSSLRELFLAHNGLEGALPAAMTALGQLEALMAGGTDLCAPADADFQAWLGGVRKRWIKLCAEGDLPPAYLVQAVQSREFPVPLVAGERALLRVFPTARQSTTASIPDVRARFFRDGRETHVQSIPGKSGPIPTELGESSLAKSANAEIPAHVIQPGLEMVIEVDPNGTLDPALGVARRIPETGRLAIEVREMPILDLTLIPFVWTQTQDFSIVDLVEAIAADPEGHGMLEDTRTQLPIGDLTVTAHEPVLSSSNNSSEVLGQTQAILRMEGGSGHYMGMMTRFQRWGGRATVGGRYSVASPYASTIAHELGHNLSLYHAPCGDPAQLDPSYPYTDGSVGAWGYNFRSGGSLVEPSRPDLMSYCQPNWISDYGFTNALRYRLFDENQPAAAVTAATKSLLLWGGVDADSVPFLHPAFVVDAPPVLPDSAGVYTVTGSTVTGNDLFSLSFTMPEVADGDGSSSFAFMLPVRPGWEGSLAAITLTGPGGSFTLDGEGDLGMAILRNPITRQVRGILRDLPTPTQSIMNEARSTAGPGLEVLFSRGIPDAEAWRR